jgi:DNA-binding GntR family transcriptional regulator
MQDQLVQPVEASTVDRAVGELRRALFAGEFAPGTPLREVPLSESMGVARSTIREALGVLVSDGMATRVTHKGVAVRRLDVDDVRDVIRARLALESAGMRSFATAGPPQRERLDDALGQYASVAAETTDPATLTEAHLRVHRAFVGLTGSERLLAAFDSIGAEIRLALAHLDRMRANIHDQVVDHTRLVDLLENGTLDDALDELRQHLLAAEDSLLTATGHGTISP